MDAVGESNGEELKEKHTNVLVDLVLRDRLIGRGLRKKILQTQSLEKKKKILQLHVEVKGLLQANADASGYSVDMALQLSTTKPLADIQLDLANAHALLRTADRDHTKFFFERSGASLLEILELCATREPITEEEVFVVRNCLHCLDDITEHPYGLQLMRKNYAGCLFVLALVVNPSRTIYQQELPAERAQVAFHQCFRNTIIALKIIVRLAWSTVGGAKVLLQCFDKVARVRRTQHASLFPLRYNFTNSPLLETDLYLLTALCLQQCKFLNSVVELEDSLHRRARIRQEIADLDLFPFAKALLTISSRRESRRLLNSSENQNFVRRFVDWDCDTLELLETSIQTQIQVFESRRSRDGEAICSGPSLLGSPAGSVATWRSDEPQTIESEEDVLDDVSDSWGQVYTFLEQNELLPFAELLRLNGWSSMNRIKIIENSELSRIGFRHQQVLAFRRGLFKVEVLNLEENYGLSHTAARAVGTVLATARGENPSELLAEAEPTLKRFGSASSCGSLNSHQWIFKVIPRAALVIQERIGGGTFGEVHKCIYHGAVCVVKRIKRAPNLQNGTSEPLAILKEAEAMELGKNHPHVVSLYGVCLDSGEFMLVSEYCPMGSLFDLIVNCQEPRYRLDQIVEFARQGVCGLVHLHSENIVHRDIAARNFLMNRDGTVKVCDFGLAKIKQGTKRESSSLDSHVNPVRWAAPESLKDSKYSTASDVYMCGVFLWELWFRSIPYPDVTSTQEVFRLVVDDHKRPQIPDSASTENPFLAQLLHACWLEAAMNRPSMQQVMDGLAAHQRHQEVTCAYPIGSTTDMNPYTDFLSQPEYTLFDLNNGKSQK